MTKTIFREAALRRLSSPEQLDQLMQITSPRGWIALIALGLLLVMAVLWSFFGTISTYVEGQGVLIRPGGVHSVVSPHSGSVTRVLVKIGDSVDKGDELMLLTKTASSGSSAVLPLVSPFSARILEIPVKEGDVVEKGKELLILEPLDDRLEAVLYVPVADGYKVRPGMKAEILPSVVTKNEFGYLLGQVKSAGKFPITRPAMMRTLENEDLVRTVSAGGPSLEIVVELIPEAGTKTGYKWSSSRGPLLDLYSGTPCQALITVSTRRPIQLAVPNLGDLLGLGHG